MAVMLKEIQTICEECHVPASVGWTSGISAQAAMLIAAGRLDPPVRRIILRRIATHPIKNIFIPEHLRRYFQEMDQLQLQREKSPHPVVTKAIDLRQLNVQRKINKIRGIVQESLGHNDNFRSVRKARKSGTHLVLEHRDAIFESLQLTPTPNLNSGNLWEHYTQTAIGSANYALNILPFYRKLNSMFDASQGFNFLDSYDTLLYIAAKVYDEIYSSSAWNAEFFAPLTSQINIHTELSEISRDALTLRQVCEQLNEIDPPDLPAFLARKDELAYVWKNLCLRVQSLADMVEVLELASDKLVELNRFEQSRKLHNTIDELVARQSRTDLSRDTAERVSAQINAGRHQLEDYRRTLLGNIAQVLQSKELTTGQ